MNKQLTIEDLATKLKPILGSKIDDIYMRYTIADSMEEKNEILQILTGLYQKHLNKLLDKNVLLEPPKKVDVEGEYSLANVNYSNKELFPFGLREQDWPRHVCVTGMSGSGKTTFAFNILKSFIKKDKPFLVFDWKKSFRPLMGIDNSLMTFTVGNDKIANSFKTNINRPPEGVSPKEWINTLCDLLTESFMVSFGVHKIILETLDELFEGWGVYNGGKHYPNWQHVKKMLEQKARDAKGRETGWYESALRVATVLTFGDFGKVVNYDGKKAVSVEDLFNKKAIFELNSLSNIEKKFFCEFILTYIYKHKKAKQNNIEDNFNHAILVDEAHNVFLKNKTHFVSESVTDMVYREMREYGTSLICLDQHISKLSDTVTGNSACHIAFQQQLPEDIEDISSLMQLKDRKDFFSKLPVGKAIIKLSERHTSPFLVNVPFIDLRKYSIEDEKVASRMQALIDGHDVEKNYPKFKEKIENPVVESLDKNVEQKSFKEFIYERPNTDFESQETQEISIEEKPKIQEIEKIEEEPEKKINLSKTEEVLLEFAINKKNEKWEIKEIEKILEQGVKSGYYTISNVIKVMNALLEKEFNKFKKPIEKKQIVEIKPKEEIFKYLKEDEKKFMNYLLKNSEHNNSTVELYKKIGLSARKGNVVKNNLIEKNLITIKEEKNNKGWKKLIRLSNSYSQL